MNKVTDIFSALSDPIRLRILAMVDQENELCVCELVGALELPQPKVSRHCRTLSEANLMQSRREAQWVLYSLSDTIPAWGRQAMEAAIAGVKEDPQFLSDRERLKSVERPPVRCDTKEAEAC